ncbi:hypothetical protein HWI79_1577 [Cryptosporidium felis]|nr:hypothetical protein HWI79_1577 [Cryptosporidium felis]
MSLSSACSSCDSAHWESRCYDASSVSSSGFSIFCILVSDALPRFPANKKNSTFSKRKLSSSFQRCLAES